MKRAVLRKISRVDRPSKFGISVPQDGGGARKRWFLTAGERDAEFDRLRRMERAEGRASLYVSAGDVVLLRELRGILGDVDPRVAARYFVEHERPDSTITLGEARRGFLRRLEFKRVSKDTLDHNLLALGRLVSGFGEGRRLAEIGGPELLEFVIELGKGFAPVTIANHCTIFRTFFRWGVEQGYIGRNPMDAVGPIEVPEKEPEFMGVDDVAAFFGRALAVRPAVAPMLALSFFGGLRSSSVERLERDDLDFEQEGIRFRGPSHKTGRRFFVQGFPDNLWRWLEPWRGVAVLPRFSKSNFIRIRAEIYRGAGVEFPHNAGRHSFCTYHVALFGSADRTATLLTHRGSVSVLYDHYRGNATRADAERYFSIVPEGQP